MSALPKPLPQFFPLRFSDLERVSGIEHVLYEFPWSVGNFRDSLNSGYSCWSCFIQGELIGYAVLMTATNEAHLLNISVATAWQGNGLGTALLDYLSALARDRDCHRMLLEVRVSNLDARRLYERNGFIAIGERKNYYPARNGREDGIVLARKL